MTLQRLNPREVAAPAGAYSHGVAAPAAGRWLYVSGQIGVGQDGTLAADMEGQAETAWRNLTAVLAAAGMDANDLVKVTTYLTDPKDLAPLRAARARYLGDARPASTLVIVAALADPSWRVEVEAVAWRA